MLNKIIIPIVFFSYSVAKAEETKVKPKTAYYWSYFDDESNVALEEVIRDMEKGQKDPFMHESKSLGGLKISFQYESLQDNRLGQATSYFLYKFCSIKISPEVRPGGFGYYSGKEHLKAVLRHEIGHCFGMPHDPNPQAVMHWGYDGYNYRNRNSIREFNKDLMEYRDKD